MFYKFNIISESRLESLYRLINILLKRKINLNKMNLYFFKKNNNQYFKIVFIVEISDKKIETIARLIKKIIEIEKISYKRID